MHKALATSEKGLISALVRKEGAGAESEVPEASSLELAASH